MGVDHTFGSACGPARMNAQRGRICLYRMRGELIRRWRPVDRLPEGVGAVRALVDQVKMDVVPQPFIDLQPPVPALIANNCLAHLIQFQQMDQLIRRRPPVYLYHYPA